MAKAIAKNFITGYAKTKKGQPLNAKAGEEFEADAATIKRLVEAGAAEEVKSTRSTAKKKSEEDPAE